MESGCGPVKDYEDAKSPGGVWGDAPTERRENDKKTESIWERQPFCT